MILSHHARALQLFGYLAHLQKNISKICDFHFSFDLYAGIIVKQLNKMFFFFTFHFSLLFPFFFPVVLPYCGPRCITPLHYPVVGSKSSSQPLRKLMT